MNVCAHACACVYFYHTPPSTPLLILFCVPASQGHDGRGALVTLPSTCAFVDVYFHRTPPAQLASRSPVIAALLAAKPRITRGSHRVPMARLVAAAGMSSSAVRVDTCC